MIEELFTKPTLIFGCGNVLLGDDGFGPAVVEYLLEHYTLPDDVYAVDVGTGIRDLLFDYVLMPNKPKRIFIVDSVCQPARQPGELFELDLRELPVQKQNDFSVHQFPATNLLEELRTESGVDVRVLAVQVKKLPEEVLPGFSEEVSAAVPMACRWLLEQIGVGS
jgi:coenzyme F420 hydrogenase subunit delta